MLLTISFCYAKPICYSTQNDDSKYSHRWYIENMEQFWECQKKFSFWKICKIVHIIIKYVNLHRSEQSFGRIASLDYDLRLRGICLAISTRYISTRMGTKCQQKWCKKIVPPIPFWQTPITLKTLSNKPNSYLHGKSIYHSTTATTIRLMWIGIDGALGWLVRKCPLLFT